MDRGGHLPTLAILVAACAYGFTVLDVLLLNTVLLRPFQLQVSPATRCMASLEARPASCIC